MQNTLFLKHIPLVLLGLLGAFSSLEGCSDATSAAEDASAEASLGDAAAPTWNADAYTDALAGRDLKCSDGQARSMDKQNEDRKWFACYGVLFGADRAATVTKCIAERDCSKSEDGCIGDLTRAEIPEVRKYAEDCIAKQASCKSGGSGFSDDYCYGVSTLFSDATLATAGACIAKPCADVSACLQAIVTTAGCPK